MKTVIKKVLKQIIFSDFVNSGPISKYPFDLKKGPAGYFRSFGELNKDKIFYIIWRDHFGSGFFSNIQHVIAHIKIADSWGMVPIVDFENFKTLYNEDRVINGTMNAWEYYFNQTSPFKLDEVYKSKWVYFCDGTYSWDLGSYLSDPLMYHSYIKYMSPQKAILQKIDTFWNAYFHNKRVLGVHFRGKEQNVAVGHPFCPTLKQMIETIDSILQVHKIEKIFLVSESKEYIDALYEKFGDLVIVTQCYRAKNKVNSYKIYPRKDHKYLLGEEIMIDAFLLSKCCGLLHSSSNVSEFARFINNKQYEFRYTINNGVNSRNPLLAKYLYRIKKTLPKNCGGLKYEVEKF